MVFHFAIKSTKCQQKILGHDPICVYHSFEVLHHKSDEEQGWRSGESTRLHHMWPGFESCRRRHMWLSLLLVLSFTPRDFSTVIPVLPPP